MAKSVNIPGYSHVNPVPAAARVGSLVVSSGITSAAPGTGAIASSLEDQCAQVFANVRAIVEAAGGAVEDIVRMTFYLDDTASRQTVNRFWLEMFPDEEARPARRTMRHVHVPPQQVSCEFIATLERQ